MGFGLFLLRVVLGGLFVGHGLQKLLGWFGGQGLEGTGRFFESLGYRPGRRHAALAGLVEAGAGAMLVIGLWVPLAAAGIIGVMTNAIGSVHADNGPWNTDGGYEYPLVAAVAATTLAFTGPGLASVTDVGGAITGTMAAVVGLVLGAVLLAGRDLAAATAGREDDSGRERRDSDLRDAA